MTFHTDEATCNGSGVTLTTASAPDAYTCFNLTDLFSQSNDTGYQLGQAASSYWNPADYGLSLGVNYTLSNLGAYVPGGNYSRVTVKQVNLTSDEAEEGKQAGRSFQTYSLPDCEQLSRANGGDDPIEWNPWYRQSCQTADEGECHTVPHTIQSFAIAKDDTSGDTCANWAYLGAASRSERQYVWLFGGIMAAAAISWAIV